MNDGNQFAVKIDWVSASYKHLYCHRDHIDSTNMLFLWNNCTVDVHSLGGIVIMLIIYIYIFVDLKLWTIPNPSRWWWWWYSEENNTE